MSRLIFLALNVADLERSVACYRDGFGIQFHRDTNEPLADACEEGLRRQPVRRRQVACGKRGQVRALQNLELRLCRVGFIGVHSWFELFAS